MNQRGKEHQHRESTRPRILPSNVLGNKVVARVPDLFLGEVDPIRLNENAYDNKGGFFKKILDAGLTLDKDNFFLEEIRGFKRESTPVVDFAIVPEKDKIQVRTEDGRELTLKFTKYRAEYFGEDGKPIKDLDSIRVSTLNEDNMTFLLFSIIEEV